MNDFDYEAPVTLQDAVAMLSAAGGKSRLLAGGTDLIDHIRTGRRSPQTVVDVKRIPELNTLEIGDDGLVLGAAVPCSRVTADEAIVWNYSALTDSCGIIGGIQIQNRATVGGNLCNGSPAADSGPSVIALGGVCTIAGPNGTRELDAAEFMTAPGATALANDEILVSIRFPAPLPNSGSHYQRFIPRNEMDIAVVGVGVSVTLNDSCDEITAARISLGAVAPTPILAEGPAADLIGKKPDDEVFAAAGDACRALTRPISDMRGTEEFRRHVVGVLVKRSLVSAVERAKR